MIKYPECDMNVAVVFNSTVKIYGWNHLGFRPLKSVVPLETHPEAVTYAVDYNEIQRQAIGLKGRK